VTPRAFAELEYDVRYPGGAALANGNVATTDPLGAEFGLGVNVALTNGLAVDVEASTTQFRENTENTSLSASVTYSF
jgi:hypothetical protein